MNGLVYPVPDPDLPFLGVHFTNMVTGEVEAGPNAVFAFAREGYTFSTVDLRDTFETVAFGGAWRLAAKYWRVGAFEVYRSLSKPAFVRSLRQLVPAITGADLVRVPPACAPKRSTRRGGSWTTSRSPRRRTRCMS